MPIFSKFSREFKPYDAPRYGFARSKPLNSLENLSVSTMGILFKALATKGFAPCSSAVTLAVFLGCHFDNLLTTSDNL